MVGIGPVPIVLNENAETIEITDMRNYHSHPIKRFDFEHGYLIKSPCKSCVDQTRIPDCFDNCRTLDRVQTTLAQGVVTTCKFSPFEPYTILYDDGQKK